MSGDLAEHNMPEPMVNLIISSVLRIHIEPVTAKQVIQLCSV